MTREQVRQYMEGHRVANDIALEEARKASYQDRWKAIRALWSFSHGTSPHYRDDDSEYEKWTRLRTAYFEKYG